MLRITGHQSSPAGRAVIELATRSTAFPLFCPARRAREPYLSPAPRWAFRSCIVPVHPVPSSVRLPRIRRRPFRRKLGGRCRVPPSRSHACTRPLPAALRSSFSRFASTAVTPKATRSHLIRGPDFAWRPPSPTARGFGGGYLATIQAFWANSTPGPRLCIRPNSEAWQSIKWRQYVDKS